MNDDKVVKTLLLEAHRCVDEAADEAVAKIGLQRRRPAPNAGDIDIEALLAYPPKDVLSPEEEQALRSMDLSTVERSALTKLVADGCATAFFRFFNLIDATGDPVVKPPHGTWSGAWLTAPKDDRDCEMLHDEFYKSYGTYEKVTGRRDGTR
jgi:hypothetical protein